MPHAIPKIEYGSFIPTIITFDYPPSDPSPEALTINRKTSESLSGMRQVSLNSIEATRKLKFRFLSEAKKASLESFIQTFAAKGFAFKYFDDALSSSYKTYELDQEKVTPKTIAPTGANTYIYEMELQLRRVVDDAIPEGYLEQTILNNQASPVNIAGLILDSSSYRTIRIFYEIWRKTDSNEVAANGSFVCTYSDSLSSWEMSPGSYEGDVHGVAFEVEATGQVKYTSDNLAGTSYQGVVRMRNFTIVNGA
jgi:hypothetical protein